MSTNIRAPIRPALPVQLALMLAFRHLAEIAAHVIASIVLRRAASRAHRELVAMDSRLLADIGLARAELSSLLDALAEARTKSFLAQFPWNCPRMGA
jgi:uncharacterized protein YjiS (DUF1127 family)